jgi:hypothetical protein
VARNTLKIERYYGSKSFEIIMENLVSIKLSNFKLSSEANENLYYNIDTNTRDMYKKINEV